MQDGLEASVGRSLGGSAGRARNEHEWASFPSSPSPLLPSSLVIISIKVAPKLHLYSEMDYARERLCGSAAEWGVKYKHIA